jgi:polyhydroxyalkanoate synthesis regulator phasin
MAQTKKSRGTQKKTAAKTRFYLVKTVQETRDRVTEKLEDYSQTYIERPIKNGKALVKDLKKAPRKTLSAWIDDGKETISDLNKETRATVSGMLKDGRVFLTKAGQKPRQTLNDVLDDGKAKIEDLSEDTRSRMADLKAETRSFLEGIGKDARLVVDEVVSGSRQALDRIPGKQKIEKEVRSRIRTLPAQFNLPSKKDIDDLARRANRLNKKVEALQRAVAA